MALGETTYSAGRRRLWSAVASEARHRFKRSHHPGTSSYPDLEHIQRLCHHIQGRDCCWFKLLRPVHKKPSILKSLALWLFVFACFTVAVGILTFSMSSPDNKSDGFPALFVLSLCIIGFGILLAFVSFVTGMDELFG